jgi:hypothetical protein
MSDTPMTRDIPDEIRDRHDPMLLDSEQGISICARCDEIWPCDAAQLIALIEVKRRDD